MMTDSPRSRFWLPRRGWRLLATAVLVVGIVNLTVVLVVRIDDHLSVWPPHDPGMKAGSPIIGAALGIILAAFGIWLIVRLVSRGKKPSGRFCACVVLVIAVGGLSNCLPNLLSYHREQQIVEKVEGCGGIVYTETGGPYWLRWLVGKDRMKKWKVFERVHGVTLFSAEVPDSGMAQLNSLPNLEGLHLNLTKVTDANLVDLRGFTKLECRSLSLSLTGTTVTDDGLAHLNGLANLRVLFLDGTAATEKGIEELQKALPHCTIRR